MAGSQDSDSGTREWKQGNYFELNSKRRRLDKREEICANLGKKGELDRQVCCNITSQQADFDPSPVGEC